MRLDMLVGLASLGWAQLAQPKMLASSKHLLSRATRLAILVQSHFGPRPFWSNVILVHNAPRPSHNLNVVF